MTRSSAAVTCAHAVGWKVSVLVTRSTECAVCPGASVTGCGRTEASWAAALPIWVPPAWPPTYADTSG